MSDLVSDLAIHELKERDVVYDVQRPYRDQASQLKLVSLKDNGSTIDRSTLNCVSLHWSTAVGRVFNWLGAIVKWEFQKKRLGAFSRRAWEPDFLT